MTGCRFQQPAHDNFLDPLALAMRIGVLCGAQFRSKAASQDHEFHSKMQSSPRQTTKSTASASASLASYFKTKPPASTKSSSTPQSHSPPPSKSKKKSHSNDASSKKFVAKASYHADPHCSLGLVAAVRVGGKRCSLSPCERRDPYLFDDACINGVCTQNFDVYVLMNATRSGSSFSCDLNE